MGAFLGLWLLAFGSLPFALGSWPFALGSWLFAFGSLLFALGLLLPCSLAVLIFLTLIT